MPSAAISGMGLVVQRLDPRIVQNNGTFFIFGRNLQWGYTNKLRVRATLKFQKKGRNPRWPPKKVKESKFIIFVRKVILFLF